MNKKYIIYGLVCPISGQIRYIGATSMGLKLRYRCHINHTKSNRYKSKKDNWVRNLLSNGLKPNIIEIECTDTDNWQEREIYWIDYYRKVIPDLLNETNGGLGGNGFISIWKNNPTKKLKLHIIKPIKKRGNYVWKDGVPYSPPKEVIKKREATRCATIAKSGMKTPSSSKGKTTEIIQYTRQGKIVGEYKTTTLASMATGIKRSTITENLRGANKTCFGFIFKFKYPKNKVA